jgi:GrpB-like predicted nucleotidyltransferase (UPF0157 family)
MLGECLSIRLIKTKNMRIAIHDYNDSWPFRFQALANRLKEVLKIFEPNVEHIGSTAVPGLAAKAVIDIAVGLKTKEELDMVVESMLEADYIYYEVYNQMMPERRLFVQLKEDYLQHNFAKVFKTEEEIPHEAMHQARIANIHIWVEGSDEWRRHIAFREYLRYFPSVRDQYSDLKKKLSLDEWKNMMAYNDAKAEFIQEEQKKALEWYHLKY